MRTSLTPWFLWLRKTYTLYRFPSSSQISSSWCRFSAYAAPASQCTDAFTSRTSLSTLLRAFEPSVQNRLLAPIFHLIFSCLRPSPVLDGQLPLATLSQPFSLHVVILVCEQTSVSSSPRFKLFLCECCYWKTVSTSVFPLSPLSHTSRSCELFAASSVSSSSLSRRLSSATSNGHPALTEGCSSSCFFFQYGQLCMLATFHRTY